ncbi:tryptophan dimethylallyltransferase family protein [Streptomyces sp. TRM68416]|uniref:tryptophan dimethylallyltransferase family protein n=1 Tax=Streptomyces sp. TRM68416 TaxID=2758412 RepID=UPI001661EC4D|nr:tryptophan dimethylallyltransferase family protein [Streptomyces sp. TRM68416]MBD0842956.1 prenyltransferase [Streptomyces sp. TRM68416]
MTSTGPSQLNSSSPAAAGPSGSAVTLGEHLSRQLSGVCGAVGVSPPDGGSTRSLLDLLGASARRPLAAGPPSPSFVSDDHSPAEFSVSFPTGEAPTVRVVVEPGCAARSFAESARVGRRALEALAERWSFSTEPLTRVDDLFFPAAAQGPFALWCAMDLRRDRAPGVKVYVNPACHGRGPAAQVTEEALTRFGFGRAWPALLEHGASRGPDGDEFVFFAIDMGAWQTRRVKVYIAHRDFTVTGAQAVSRLLPGGCAQQLGEFCRTVGDTEFFDRRPLVSCLSFTEWDQERPSGYTLHVPVRDYVRDDRVARNRAATVLRRHGMDTVALDRALAAMTDRGPSEGVGLISYVSLVQSTRQPPRLTVYLSPEGYEVRPPREPTRPLADADRP